MDGLQKMRSYQIKRERPSFKTAHEFHKEGSFLVDPKIHGLSGQAREDEIKRVGDELCELVKKQFPRTQKLEYAILKSLLIVEYAITQYIRCFSLVAVDAEEIRFTFSQRLEIAYLMGFGANDPLLLPTIERLNKTRNQVAHTFSFDRVAFDEMLRINSENYDVFKPKNDRERISRLRVLCAYVCGRIAGEVSAAYYIANHLEQRVKTRITSSHFSENTNEY